MSLAPRGLLGIREGTTFHKEATRRVVRWAQEGQSVYVCLAIIHMIMESFDSEAS